MSPTRIRTLSRYDQMAALVSPARQELLDVLARMGTASIAEIASALGRRPDGLYYHVRTLVRVGIVHPAGERVRAGRREALYRAGAGQVALRYAKPRSRQARTLTAVVAAMLRLGTRDFRRALASGDARVEGPGRELWALRTTGWLRPSQVRRVNRLIRSLSEAASHKVPSGRLYAVTVLLTPLVRRSGRAGRRAGKEASS